ncbi:chemotaxis protein CheA [Bowmanella denitrificans]|uniref:Chemotaxis protein CheA n=1 Tax=Bowmanella denitrificans TaxID=366582 RepID=A0ABN0XFM0_9ALTE
MDMHEAQQLFINEAEELLDVMESCLLEVEAGDATIDAHIDAIFRAAHTIKGSAGLFGFDAIVAFTHSVESVLEQVRADKLEFTPALAELLLDCHRHMVQMIQSIADPELASDKNQGTKLLAALDVYLHPPKSDEPLTDTSQAPIPDDSGHWSIHIDYGREVFRDGMDPCSQLKFLQTLGQVDDVRVTADFSDGEFDPECCYLRLQMALISSADKQQIEEVFEFIQDSSKVTISAPKALVNKVQACAEDDARLGETLVNSGALTKRELEMALAEQRRALQENRQAEALGNMLIKQGAVDKSLVSAALSKQKNQEHKRPIDLQFLKVDARKLDNLIGLIGELVTAGAANELLIGQLAHEKLQESFAGMTLLVEQIRDAALGLRMVQIGESFGRLKRIVRDVSKELGKDINLEVLGAETELDKSMVEKLSDPLMHIVRNAIDHGIEPQDVRIYKGKPSQGQLCLNAYHEAGAVVIEITDDGAGLDPDRIRAKAIENGILDADKQLSKEDIYKLIFEPGFSTASAITNLSGRGVGMDVVKRNIEELRGQISIASDINQGTRFRIRLPLTLAIIDGFEVTVGDAHLVIPVNMIQECLAFDAEALAVERDYLNLRGEVLPFVRVRDILKIPGQRLQREHVVVVQFGENRAGLVVETLLGELQAVIKPLNKMFRAIRGIGGSTVMGSGDIGFILDVPQLIEFTMHKESRQCAPASDKSEKEKHE